MEREMPTLEQLEAQEAEADRLVAELAGKQDDAGDAGGEPTPDDQAGAKDDAGGDEPAPGGETPPQPGTTNAEVEALKAQVVELQAQLTKLQAAHDTLRGKTYAEVPRVLSENKNLLIENKALKDRIEELESREPATTTSGAPVGKSSEILNRIKAKVDDEVADQIQELVAAEVEERVNARVGRVEGSVEGLRKTAAQLAEDRYLARLTQLVPDWREIAPTPEYSSFLAQTDDFSGVMLHTMAVEALNSLDADRQAKFFLRFKAQNGAAAAKAVTSASGDDGVPTVRVGATGKEALLGPGSKSRTEKRAGEEEVEYITAKQLEQWNRKDFRRSLTPEQEAALDARIDRAIQNRRIVP